LIETITESKMPNEKDIILNGGKIQSLISKKSSELMETLLEIK